MLEIISRHEDDARLFRCAGIEAQEIPTHDGPTHGGLHFVFLETRLDERLVDLALIRHRPHEFEFFIETPRA